MREIKITDFDFRFLGSGQYWVIYEYPRSNRRIAARVADMQYIDSTKNAETPTKTALKALKQYIYRNGYRL